MVQYLEIMPLEYRLIKPCIPYYQLLLLDVLQPCLVLGVAQNSLVEHNHTAIFQASLDVQQQVVYLGVVEI